ncbi:MAG: DEAD/DEAH box helicase family protein [Bacilli bacterium]|nr:DEAD/DEAH box helicase family protein [Bacilli bacterium]
MPKIVRMEDIIDIVGMSNYIKALEFNIDDLTYLGCEPSGNKLVLFNFEYIEKDKHLITLFVDADKNVKEVRCDCSHFDALEYCPHVALVIMYFLTNEELVDQGLSVLKNRYDEEFNRYLFSKMTLKKKKKQLEMEILLRPSSFRNKFEYELIIKIGQDKKYVLKKQLEEFLNNYPEGNEKIEFGKSFLYSPEDYFFSKEDEKIVDFLKFYVDSQTINRSYYGYYGTNKVTSIVLSGKSLKEFLKLLENHPFKIEEGYHTRSYSQIQADYPFKTNMDEINGDLRVVFHYEKIKPLTEDYEYFIDENACYHIDSESASFLKLIVTNHKQQLLFKKEEYKDFSSTILPKIYGINSNIKMSGEVEEKFILEKPNVKYFFEKKRNIIEAHLKLFISNYEWDLFEEAPIYVMKDKNQEQEWIEELIHHHFIFNEKKQVFELSLEDDIVTFLETGLKALTEHYEVYVSKDLKDIKIIKKTRVESQFGIGRDNILSYQFSIDGIDKKEISNLLDAVRMKKKYYRLKNGNYMNLEENKDLEKMGNLIDELEIRKEELGKEQIEISKYKSLQIERLVEEAQLDFVKLDNDFEELIHNFSQYKNAEINLSKSDLDILRDYQETGVKWLSTISACGFGGILADEMGLGKSIQTIMYIKSKLKRNKDAKFLIVVPTSLIYNWENEFQKFEKNISILLVNGTKQRRMELLKKEYQVLITSYGLLRQDIDSYKEIHFDTCIIDEAQNIKNLNTEVTKACKEIYADIKFALTGTPIENSILELWSIFDFIMPGYLSNLSKFKKHYNIREIEENPELLYELNKQIAPFILRRKKKDVLKDLPEKLENQVLVELDEYEKKLYIGEQMKTKELIEETIQKEGFMKSQILILSLLTKLREICIDPRLILEQETKVSSKLKTLLEILKGSISNGHKILVFSQFSSALSLIRQELDQENISYYYLDGSTPSKRRMEMANAFNVDETSVFLISLKAGGTGLNLTSADIVIHVDPWWNPQVENQATDRSHRIGQKNVVEVIKLVAKGTIEEKIVELQNKKKNLSEQVIEGEERDQIILSKLTEKELRNLLES